jgi:ABC transport system ATP-binding/permease protein
MTIKTGIKTEVSQNPYLELNRQGKALCLELTQSQHVLGRDPMYSDLLLPEEWNVVSRRQAILRKDDKDYYIYDGDGLQASSNKLYVNHSLVTPSMGYRLIHGAELEIGQDPNTLIKIRYFNPSNQQASPERQRSISLKQKPVVLGRDFTTDLPLDAQTVSRRHATITPSNRGYILKDHSTNGVFVNGQKISDSVLLPNNAKIRIGPFSLVLRDDNLEIIDAGDRIRLEAHNVVLETKGKRRIDDISLAIEPGQFVALVGGSGAGKSTFMRTLLGIERPTKGVVYLNGEDLQRNFNIYRTQIGYVPQDDIIHRDLTVKEVLTYAAKLRLPPDINVNQVIEQTLQDVEMSHRREAKVSELSGGQRKRVSIGVELLADPKLFFLDEPTSGLDPGLDKKMMELLRKLADQGRTIILVTHATTNIKLCDRIVFLGQGGKLCYFGAADECLRFFNVKEDFSDIYNRLERPENVVDCAEKFFNSNDYHSYITNHLSSTNQTSQNNFKKQQNASKVNFTKQLSILTQRYLKIQSRDRVNLALGLLTAPIGISLITFALKDKHPFILPEKTDPTLASLALRVLFVFTCAALWVGLSSSLQEVVKESAIYLRERLVNLSVFAYIGSKLNILAGLAILQTILISLTILVGFKSPQPELISWVLGLGITTFLTLLASFSLGLLVSAFVKNGSQANSALPLLLLPQIIFSGVLFKMEGIASKISWMMLSRWSIGAYGSIVNLNAMVPEAIKLPDGSTVPQAFEVTSVYHPNWSNLNLNWGILLLHSIIYLSVTCYLQKRKDIF